MSKPIVIEVGGEPLGVVVPKGDAYRFLAVKLPVFDIDGHMFKSVEEARCAASRTVKGRERKEDARSVAA